MKQNWVLSQGLHDLITEKVRENGPAGIGTEFFPSIIWSLGGVLRRGDATEDIAPHYTLGWVKRSDMSRFAALPHDAFGRVAFQPSRDDEEIGGGTVDIDGSEIFVRRF